MSGDLELKRAKRSKYYHTSHKSQFDGDETQHVKGDLAASVDGSYSLKADEADFHQTPIKNMINAVRSVKTTVAHSALTKTATQYVTIYRASPGDSIANFIANVTASFGVTATPKAIYLRVGDVSNISGFAASRSLAGQGWKFTEETNATKGTYFKNASGARVLKTFTAGADIRACFVASAGGAGMILASLNKGSIDLYLDVMSRA